MIPTARELFLDVSRMTMRSSRKWERLEDKFFHSIELSNGTHKRTWAGRLDDVDQILIAVFQALEVHPESFLDVAVSSGISTVLWYDALCQAGFHPRMTATDLTMNAYLLRLRRWIHVLVDKEGFPLQYEVCGYVWRPRCRMRFYALGNGLLTTFWNLIYRRVDSRYGLVARLRSMVDGPLRTDDPFIKARIKLVTRKLRDNPEIELLDDNLLAAVPTHMQRRFQVIRAANILNRGYFSVEQLRKAVTHLRERLTGPGAFLLIVRTDETSANNGSVFRMRADGSFEILKRIGTGSEVEDIVLSL